MTTAPCRLCGRAIVWAESPDGRAIRLDPRPAVYRVLDTRLGSPQAELLKNSDSTLFSPNETAFMVSHFATCPEAHRVRRGAAPTEALEDCARCGWPASGSCALCAGNVRSLCCGDAIRVSEPGRFACARCGVAIEREWRMRTSGEDQRAPVFAA